LPGRSFDGVGRQDGFNLHAVKLSLEKKVDAAQQWAAGYKTDLIFGSGANYFQTGLNGGGTDVGAIAIKQAYVEVIAPVGTGLDIKVGVFDTCIGYELYDSGDNPNFSRSYGYALEPTQHTGILAKYNVTESLGVYAGVANTWTGGINNRAARAGGTVAETEKTFLAMVEFTFPEAMGMLAGSKIVAGVVDGLNGAPAGANSRDTTGYYAGATLKTPIESLNVGFAYDYRDDGVGVATAANNRAYAIAGYLSFAVSEKLKLNGRIDYVNADNGTFWAGPHASTGEKLLGNTLTVDYNLFGDNVVTRLEARWDHSLNGNKPYGALPGDAEKNALSLAANIIYKF
jgi:hypothetical protein